jgi:hypothetical protein
LARPAFSLRGDVVSDNLTGLVWCRDANLAEFPLTWQGAFDFIAGLNRKKIFGFADWRLPNRHELLRLMDYQTTKPPLLSDHPFTNVRDEYWSSTTSVFEPAWAWALSLHKGAVGVSLKQGRHFYVWPVCDSSG